MPDPTPPTEVERMRAAVIAAAYDAMECGILGQEFRAALDALLARLRAAEARAERAEADLGAARAEAARLREALEQAERGFVFIGALKDGVDWRATAFLLAEEVAKTRRALGGTDA